MAYMYVSVGRPEEVEVKPNVRLSFPYHLKLYKLSFEGARPSMSKLYLQKSYVAFKWCIFIWCTPLILENGVVHVFHHNRSLVNVPSSYVESHSHFLVYKDTKFSQWWSLERCIWLLVVCQFSNKTFFIELKDYFSSVNYFSEFKIAAKLNSCYQQLTS